MTDARDTGAVAAGDAVAQARTRARRRLVGAAVLLGIGIVGFPLVFETQPRPIPVDIPIEIPKKDGLPPLAVPGPGPATTANHTLPPAPRDSTVITESASEAGREVTPASARAASAVAPSSRPGAAPASATARSAAASAPPRAAAASAPTRVAAASTPRPATAAGDDGQRARALLEGKPASTSAAASAPAGDAARFVVQVGAFADAESARDTRQKVEKLGLKTYTQVAQTPAGSRIRVRVGPFASRDAAEAALARAKAGGVSAVVLTL